VSRGGRRERIRNLRALRADGHQVFDMRAGAPAARADPSGLVDARFAKYLCGACGKPPATGEALLRCGRCRAVSYCGPACQRAHWKAHKMNC
jgi:hypothetical protein